MGREKVSLASDVSFWDFRSSKLQVSASPVDPHPLLSSKAFWLRLASAQQMGKRPPSHSHIWPGDQLLGLLGLNDSLLSVTDVPFVPLPLPNSAFTLCFRL